LVEIVGNTTFVPRQIGAIGLKSGTVISVKLSVVSTELLVKLLSGITPNCVASWLAITLKVKGLETFAGIVTLVDIAKLSPIKISEGVRTVPKNILLFAKIEMGVPAGKVSLEFTFRTVKSIAKVWLSQSSWPVMVSILIVASGSSEGMEVMMLEIQRIKEDERGIVAEVSPMLM